MAGLRRSAAMWVLRRAAQHAFDSGAKRWEARNDAAGTAAGQRATSTGPTTGPAPRPAGERQGWARATSTRPTTLPLRVEDLVRRAWPMVDTPANRERAARFVERMRTVANRPR